MKDSFIAAIHAKKKVLLTFHSKEDQGTLVRTCAPSSIWRTTVTTFGLLCIMATVLPGCGPTREEIAKRDAESEARRKVWESEVSNWQGQLRVHAQERIAAGQSAPPKVNDLGDHIRNCTEMNGKVFPDDIVVGVTIPFRGSFICGNTKAGKEIVAWRKWYCEGSKHKSLCVLGSWNNGEPTFASGDSEAPGFKIIEPALVKDGKTGKILQFTVTHEQFNLEQE